MPDKPSPLTSKEQKLVNKVIAIAQQVEEEVPNYFLPVFEAAVQCVLLIPYNVHPAFDVDEIEKAISDKVLSDPRNLVSAS